MLLAHTVDYNVCKIYFVSSTSKYFRDIDKKQIYPYQFMSLIIHRR